MLKNCFHTVRVSCVPILRFRNVKCVMCITIIILNKAVRGVLAQLSDLLRPELFVRNVVLFDLWPVVLQCFNFSLAVLFVLL